MINSGPQHATMITKRCGSIRKPASLTVTRGRISPSPYQPVEDTVDAAAKKTGNTRHHGTGSDQQPRRPFTNSGKTAVPMRNPTGTTERHHPSRNPEWPVTQDSSPGLNDPITQSQDQ